MKTTLELSFNWYRFRYHGTESTGKFASVIFVVLLSADRYCAMCKRDWLRYRTPFVALSMTVFGWLISIIASFPLYWFADVIFVSSVNNPNVDPGKVIVSYINEIIKI